MIDLVVEVKSYYDYIQIIRQHRVEEGTMEYGHHMNDGSMFAVLINYYGKDYRDEHPLIKLDTISGFSARVEWCACFVSWCANECGYIDVAMIPKIVLGSWGAQWFKDRGQWGDNSMEPAPGTIIIFDWDGDRDPDHVGIVEYTENGVVHTLEGNLGYICRQIQYSVGNGQIYGYGLLAY